MILMGLFHTDTSYALCSITTTPLTFGNYDPFSAVPHDGTATIIVGCNEAPPPTVVMSVSASQHSGGFNPRKMKLMTGTGFLDYNVYTDSGRTQIWGDGSANTFIRSKKVTKNTPWSSTVYGRIPPGQDVSIGSYNETVTVTIDW